MRLRLTLLRLALLFGILCYLVLMSGLAWRERLEEPALLNQPSLARAASTPPFLGVTVALEQYTPNARRAALQRLRASGFGWVRQRLDWGRLESAPGAYEWAHSDALLAAVAAAQLTPVILLDGSPAWARSAQDVGVGDNPLAPPADPQTFAAFAGALAQRYGPQLRFYQIWDEPNITPHWGNRHIEPVAYAQLLTAAAVAIRAADPDAVIISAALAPTVDRGHTAIDEVYFLQRLYAAGAAPAFDTLAVQLYGFGASPADPRAQVAVLNFQRAKLIRRAMIAAGDGATPLWAVRYGWNRSPPAAGGAHSPWGTVSADTQRQYAVQALDLAWSQWPWLAALGWHSDQPVAPINDPVWGFALTPDLAAALHGWQTSAALRPRPAPPPTHSPNLLWLWGSLIGLSLWRLLAALWLLPWRNWAKHYQRVAWPLRVVFWLALIVIYHLATWPPLIVLCWVAAAGLIAAQPAVGVSLLALLLPFPYQHKEVALVDSLWSVAPAHALVIGLSPVLVVRSAQQISQWRWQEFSLSQWLTFDWLALGWLLSSLASSKNVWYWPAYGNGLFTTVIAPLLIYLAVRCFITTPDQWRWVVVALALGGLAAAISGLVDWGLGGGTLADGVRRLVGPYYSANHTALYLVRTLFVSGGLMLASSKWRRAGWLAAGGLITLALLGTVSRGAWLLGAPVGLGLLIWWWLGARRQTESAHHLRPTWLRWLTLGLLALGILIGGSLTWLLWERLTNSATIASRWQIWQTTWRLWQAFPLLGVGPGGFFWRYPAFLAGPTNEPNILHPHTVWLEIAAGWGLLGLLWFGLLLGQFGRLVWRQRQTHLGSWLLAGLVAGWLAGLAHAQVDAFVTLPDLAGWNWLVLGLVVGQVMRNP